MGQPIAEQIKSLMEAQGVTSYRLAKDVDGLSESGLSRFFGGKTATLSMDKLTSLLDYLGFELTIKKKRKTKS